MQTVQTLIRRRVLWRLIWVYTVCLCPFKRTLGKNDLKDSKRHNAKKQPVAENANLYNARTTPELNKKTLMQSIKYSA